MEQRDASIIGPALPVLAQFALIVAGIVGMIFAPPAHGRVLLVPLGAYAKARLPAAVFAHQALLLGTGPWPGSLVVIDEHENIGWPMLRLGVLAIAASPAGCGPSSQTAVER